MAHPSGCGWIIVVLIKQDGSFVRRTKALTRQHHTSFARRIVSSTQRIFRSADHGNLLAPERIDARTARDIGINVVGLC